MKMDSNHLLIASYKDKETLKRMGGTWSSKHQAWVFPKSVYVLAEIQNQLPHLAQTDAFKTVLRTLQTGRDKLKEIKYADARPTKNDKLRSYQRQDVQYLTTIPHAGVFNQPRTGKTPTTIEMIKARKTAKNMIICPASLQYNWKKEIEQWHPEASVYMYAGTAKNREHQLDNFKQHNGALPAYLIVSKDTAKRNKDDLTFPHDVCVVDEAHYLRNDDTLQTKAVYTIGYQASHRYALTGTPTVKHPSDVFGILKFLYPHKWTSKWAFINRYFHTSNNGFGVEIGVPIQHRVKELQDLLDAVSTQRQRKDVMQWLPDKQRHTHICKMDAKQEKAYKSMLEDFFIKQGDMELDTSNVLSQLMRLRQITLDPSIIKELEYSGIPSAKTEALLEAIEDGTYDEPIVIMSVFTSYLKKLRTKIEALGKRVGMIHGEMSNADKQRTAEAFQRGEIDVLLCNIKSAGTGFTLDRGEVIIFTDKEWNPSDNEQAEDRITPTQTNRVHKHFIVSMVCQNTIDEKIEAILDRKENLTAIVNKYKTVADLGRYLLS